MIPITVLAWAIVFVEAHTSYPAATVLPQIEYRELVHSGGQRIAGLINSDGVMIFDPAWSDSVADRAALVHEIVHWEQWRAGKFATTPRCMLEEEAYKVEHDYYMSQGVQPRYSNDAMVEADCAVERFSRPLVAAN